MFGLGWDGSKHIHVKGVVMLFCGMVLVQYLLMDFGVLNLFAGVWGMFYFITR